MMEFKCKAQPTADPPQDCDWPFCNCDPRAEKVFAAIEESGKLIVNLTEMVQLKDIISRAIPSIGFHWSMTCEAGRPSNLLALRRAAEEAVEELELRIP